MAKAVVPEARRHVHKSCEKISCRGKDPFALRPTMRFEQQLHGHFGKKLG